MPAGHVPATSPASRWSSRSTATCGCRRWRAATRVSCWRSAIRRSAAMAAPIPSSARSASARSRSSSTCRSSASPVPLGRITRHRVPDGQPVQGLGRSAAAVHPRLRPGLRPERAQGDGDGARRPGAARPRARRGHRPPPAQDEEFVISHSDNVQATGFVEHLKLPHYVDFQAELELRAPAARASTRRSRAADDRDAGRRRNDARPPRPTTSPISTSRPSG